MTTAIVSSLFLASCAQVKLTVDTEITARAGQPVRFDAFTKEAPKSNYTWDFGDGSKAEGATLKHTYVKQGSYTAQVKVKGDGKRGKANIKVKVGPPSALSMIPKEAGFVAVLDDLTEAKATWDLLYKIPFLQGSMQEIEAESNKGLGFFFLDEGALSSRGFDSSLGGALGVMTVEDQFVPLLVGGIKSDGKASSWIKEQIEKEGLTTKEEKLDGVTITHTYYKNREVGALTTTANFVIYSPSIKVSTDYHVKALKAAAGAGKGGSVAENEWLHHSNLSGGLSLYVQGGDFLTELSRELESDRDLRTLAWGLRSWSGSYQSIAVSLRPKGGNFEADVALWMTEEGVKNYKAAAPQVPLLSVSPSLSSGAFLSWSGRLDPVETVKQTLAGLPPNEREGIEELAGQLKGMMGIDLAEDLGKPMGAANAMIITLDGDRMAELISGVQVIPGEFIWAYELEDTETFQKSMGGLMQQAGLFLAFAGYAVDAKKIGDADVYAINLGFMEVAIGVKPGVAMLTIGPDPGTIEKSIELITPGNNEEKSQLGEQKLTLQFGQLRQELGETLKELQSNGQSTNEIEDVIDALKSFQRLTSNVYLSGDVIRIKALVELAK